MLCASFQRPSDPSENLYALARANGRNAQEEGALARAKVAMRAGLIQSSSSGSSPTQPARANRFLPTGVARGLTNSRGVRSTFWAFEEESRVRTTRLRCSVPPPQRETLRRVVDSTGKWPRSLERTQEAIADAFLHSRSRGRAHGPGIWARAWRVTDLTPSRDLVVVVVEAN
jgi:hypothetical protein